MLVEFLFDEYLRDSKLVSLFAVLFGTKSALKIRIK